MDESHDDQNFRCKIKKIWSQTYLFCCKKYPIHTSLVILLFLLYLFFPLLFKILIYASPFVGLSLYVHKVLSDINHQKIRQAEEEARRKKFAKSRRSFKSIYSDHGSLVRRSTLNKNDDNSDDTNVDDSDDVFLKSLHELLSEKKPKDIGDFESIVGKGEGSSSNTNVNSNSNINTEKDDFKGESWDVSENDDKRKDYKVVKWSDDDQKNDLDLGLSETDRTKRLESLMVRRRSRKNLGFEEKGSTENENIVQIPKVRTKKLNPFLEDKSSGNKSPGSAPSLLLKTSNPFDIPYDPHEEKLDLTGDNFHEEFTGSVRPKEPVFCRHQSFSLGALSRSAILHGKHDIPYYKDLSNKKKSIIRSDTSTLDYKRILQDSSISDDSNDSNHPKDEEEDGAEKEIDSYAARKADINFFYGKNKRGLHAVNHSMVSDMQVELSDEEAAPTLDDLDIEKERRSWLNSSNSQADSEMNENPKPLNSDTIQRNDVHEPHGASQTSVAQAVEDSLTDLTVGQASVSSSSPKSVLHQTDDDSDENPFGDRDIDNLQDQNVRQL